MKMIMRSNVNYSDISSLNRWNTHSSSTTYVSMGFAEIKFSAWTNEMNRSYPYSFMNDSVFSGRSSKNEKEANDTVCGLYY
ncbi:MAG TPA: hypothetical protein VMX17_10730 [Candidatus Glassbacteria bacterium]|nr:hypothetical protein [Candidatus Glassbacteria bacterium]